MARTKKTERIAFQKILTKGNVKAMVKKRERYGRLMAEGKHVEANKIATLWRNPVTKTKTPPKRRMSETEILLRDLRSATNRHSDLSQVVETGLKIAERHSRSYRVRSVKKIS